MTDRNALRQLLRGHRAKILALAEKYGIQTVRVFGSVARDDAGPATDIDLLVRFQAGRSLLDQIAFQQDVSELLGVTVDVVSTEGLSPYIRDDVLREAVPV